MYSLSESRAPLASLLPLFAILGGLSSSGCSETAANLDASGGSEHQIDTDAQGVWTDNNLKNFSTDDDTMGVLDNPETQQEGSSEITAEEIDAVLELAESKIGTDDPFECNCKSWARSIYVDALAITLPSTVNGGDGYAWIVNDASPVEQKAQWRSSYANFRRYELSLGPNEHLYDSFTETYGDPQNIIVFAPTDKVTTTITQGASTLSVTSFHKKGGTGTGEMTVSGTGTWSVDIHNTDEAEGVGDVAVVVLSRSRFRSDWNTAQRGDIMQMRGAFRIERTTPHTAIIDSPAGDWIDANWTPCEVTEHTMYMDQMMLAMTRYDTDYGFTVYRVK